MNGIFLSLCLESVHLETFTMLSLYYLCVRAHLKSKFSNIWNYTENLITSVFLTSVFHIFFHQIQNADDVLITPLEKFRKEQIGAAKVRDHLHTQLALEQWEIFHVF